jgi:hypothetical protein
VPGGKGLGKQRRTLAFFLECEFALLIVVFILSTTTILASLFNGLSVICKERGENKAVGGDGAYLSLILRHIDWFLRKSSGVSCSR